MLTSNLPSSANCGGHRSGAFADDDARTRHGTWHTGVGLASVRLNTRAKPSAAAVARYSPDGLNVIASTANGWGSVQGRKSFFSKFHTRTDLPATAKRLPLRSNARATVS